jgi:nitroreductase
MEILMSKLTSTVVQEPEHLEALRSAAIRATLAPSVHNTQPWQLVIADDALEISANRSRQLSVLDPAGRELLISCGCALFNARVALAGTGFEAVVERFPDPQRPDLVARLTVNGSKRATLPLATLDVVIDARHTSRRRFAAEEVPPDVVKVLVNAAKAEGGCLMPLTRLEHRLAVASWTQVADRLQNADLAYRSELRSWTTDDPTRRDGVATSAIPHIDADSHDDLPLRDFDTQGKGQLPAETGSGLSQCLFLLGTVDDDPAAWLRAGEALEHVLLELTRRGYAASPLTQVMEMWHTRAALRSELSLTSYPHLILRVGRAPASPASRRRRLGEAISEDS